MELEELYYDLAVQLRNVLENFLRPVQHIRKIKTNEMTMDQLILTIRAVLNIHRATTYALVKFCLRIHPLWRHKTISSLPVTFCP